MNYTPIFGGNRPNLFSYEDFGPQKIDLKCYEKFSDEELFNGAILDIIKRDDWETQLFQCSVLPFYKRPTYEFCDIRMFVMEQENVLHILRALQGEEPKVIRNMNHTIKECKCCRKKLYVWWCCNYTTFETYCGPCCYKQIGEKIDFTSVFAFFAAFSTLLDTEYVEDNSYCNEEGKLTSISTLNMKKNRLPNNALAISKKIVKGKDGRYMLIRMERGENGEYIDVFEKYL